MAVAAGFAGDAVVAGERVAAGDAVVAGEEPAAGEAAVAGEGLVAGDAVAVVGAAAPSTSTRSRTA